MTSSHQSAGSRPELAHSPARTRDGGAERILLAYDARSGGDDALALTAQLAVGDASVLAAIVVPFPPGTVGDPPLQPPERVDNWDQLCRALRAQGSELLTERVLERHPELRAAETVVLGDSAAASLSVLCERERPDLLVIGSTRRGRIGRVLLGSTGERIAHGASVPVAIAPRGFAAAERSPIARVGVGFDGRPESIAALELGAELARRHGAELELIAVVEPRIAEMEVAAQAFDVISGEPLRDRRAEGLRTQAEEALAAIGAQGKITIEHGAAAEELLRASGRLDLLVLGSRGYGPLGRVMLGRVSAGLSSEAPCPILLTRRAG